MRFIKYRAHTKTLKLRLFSMLGHSTARLGHPNVGLPGLLPVRIMRPAIVFGGVCLSVSVRPHKISKTTDQKLIAW